MSFPLHYGAGLILPGSFNPLHEGHEELAWAANEQTGEEVVFELSSANVHKDVITFNTVSERMKQFYGLYDVIITETTTFLDKAMLFPESTFVVGYDVIHKLFHERDYPSHEAMIDLLRELRSYGIHFMVAGRDIDGHFCTLANLVIDDEFQNMIIPIEASLYHRELSSTKIRNEKR
tara:strand:+ start:8220 stop:8750 length:531 start_codon:yes stop_codon:yes gene_type:complete